MTLFLVLLVIIFKVVNGSCGYLLEMIVDFNMVYDLYDVFLMFKEFGYVLELFMLNDLLGVMIFRKVICYIVG